jgi:hypothetical protein
LPRLYHNGALLLPDGRVLSTGGNANRATHTDAGLRVDVLGDPETFFRFPSFRNAEGEQEPFDVETYYRDPRHYFADGNSEPFVPAEIWRSEVFSPPYLGDEDDRPRVRQAPESVRYGETFTIKVEASPQAADSRAERVVLVKLGSVTHSFDFGQRLAQLGIIAAGASGDLRVEAPASPHLYPPGYYMLFCLDDRGVPSKARMVQLRSAKAV